MTITLTREEAQQVLDALQCATPPTFSAKIVEDWEKAVEFLRARLAQPEPEPVADKYLMEVECTVCKIRIEVDKSIHDENQPMCCGANMSRRYSTFGIC